MSGGEGYLDILQDQGDNHFARVAHTPTASGARTCLYVADQRRLYLAVPIAARSRRRFGFTKLADRPTPQPRPPTDLQTRYDSAAAPRSRAIRQSFRAGASSG